MIPTELVDHILSSLHSDKDYTSLESCSVVFPLLVDRHLYSQITFYISGGTVLHSQSSFDSDDTYVVDSSVFSRTLSDYPHILNYVRDVRILPNAIRSLDPQHFQAISVILSLLTRIESLTLTTVRHPCGLGSQIPWPMLGPVFSAAFQKSLRSPSIKTVVISNFAGFSLNIFKDCKALTTLGLYGLESIESEDVSTPPYPCLSSFHVNGRLSDWTRVISWAKSTLSSLHTLSLSTHSRFDFPRFRILIATCSASLVKLEINCENYFDHFNFTPSDYPQLPLLEHIVFRCNLRLERTFRPDFSCLKLLIPFLTTIPSTSPIRLTLHITFYLYYKSTPDWSNITNILVLPIFHHPIKLHVALQSWCPLEVTALLVDSLEQHYLVKKLLVDGKLVLIKGKPRHPSRIRICYLDEEPD